MKTKKNQKIEQKRPKNIPALVGLLEGDGGRRGGRKRREGREEGEKEKRGWEREKVDGRGEEA
jgi:hypothetical protein